MSKKINDQDISRMLDEFMDDSGSDREDDNVDNNSSDEDTCEAVYTNLLPVAFENECANLFENLVEMVDNIDNDLTVPITDNRRQNMNEVPIENIESNYDNIAEEWGFDDTIDEIQHENFIQNHDNNEPFLTNRDVERRSIESTEPVICEWERVNPEPQPHVFTSMSGVSDEVLGKSTEIEFFSIFFPDNLIKLIKKETNRYAYSIIRSLRRKNMLKQNSIWHKWKPVNISEIYSFFSIILHMSIIPKPHIKDFWSKNAFIHSTFASKLMTRDRFSSIFSMLHLNNNANYISRGKENHDSLFKIRPYIDLINKKTVESYQPGQNLTIDEGMCPFRGRIHFRVYMKNKPHKYGMKLYILSDPLTGYTLKFEIYSGKNQKDNSIIALFDRLLEEYYYKGHTVYMDRFYTSPALLNALWKKNTNGVGTVMSNRKGLPKEVVKEKLQKGEMTYSKQGPLVCIKWRDTRDVLMLSTAHSADMKQVSVRSKTGELLKFKPNSIIDYNINKTGVDHGDQMVSYYPFQRKSLKWWKKMFFHLFMVTVVNSYILKNRVNQHKKITLRTFIINLGLQLAEKSGYNQDNYNDTVTNRLSGRHFIARIPSTASKQNPRRVCKVCADKIKYISGKRGRKETSFYCKQCDTPLCIEDCFEKYHTINNYWL